MKLKTVVKWVGYVAISFFVLFPIFWGLRTSVAPSYDVRLIPTRITFEHYNHILFQRDFFVYLKNSLSVALATTFAALLMSLLAGYALARFEFPGRRFGIFFLLFPLLPAIAILVPLIRYLNSLGLINTLTALIVVNIAFNLSFAVWMVRGFCLAIPVEIEEAAMLDGCSRIGVLFRITIPLATFGLVAAAIFVFINTWNNYLYAFAFTSSPKLRVLPLAVLAFLGAWGTNWGGLTAMGLLTTIPPIVLFLIFQKWFIEGMVGR